MKNVSPEQFGLVFSSLNWQWAVRAASVLLNLLEEIISTSQTSIITIPTPDIQTVTEPAEQKI